MSLIVCDLTNFILGATVYTFEEEKTEHLIIKNNFSEELAKYIIAQNKFDKLVLVGNENYTLEIKNQVSSSLQSQYGYSKPIEIELKNNW